MNITIKSDSLKFFIKEGKRVVGILEGEDKNLLVATFFSKGKEKITTIWALKDIPEQYNLEPIFTTTEDQLEWKKSPTLSH